MLKAIINKYSITCGIFIATANSMCAQLCGTTKASSYVSNTTPNSNSSIWVNLNFFIVRETTGSGGLASNSFCTSVSYLNSIYNQYGIYFNNTGVHEINNDELYNLNDDGSKIFNSGGQQPNAINIFYVNSATNSIAGCAKDIPSNAFFIVNFMANDHAIAHEMGHCFGLFHTHRGTNVGTTQETLSSCLELINGANCNVCGDLICDTPADPGLLFQVNADCNYIGTFTQNGVPYNPDTRNIMSYSHCSNRFSPQQVNAMKNRLIETTSVPATSLVNTGISTPLLNGADYFCTSSAFTVSNIRPGFAVTGWTSSNPGVATVNVSGIATGVSSGVTILRANISDGCETYYAYKSVGVGKPSALSGTYQYGTFTYPISNPSTGIGVSGSTPNIGISLTQLLLNATYSWNTISSSGPYGLSTNGPTASINLSPGSSLVVTCQASNVCGSSPITTFYCYNYSRYRIDVSPNPANDDLLVKAIKVEDVSTLINPNEKLLVSENPDNTPVKVVDAYGVVKLSGQLSGEQMVCSLKNLQNGIYYLHISEGENLIVKQLIIQH